VTVYVDDARHPFAGTLMCQQVGGFARRAARHGDCVGVTRKWLQKRAQAFSMHFDIAQSKRKFVWQRARSTRIDMAPRAPGAAPRADQAKLAQIARIRARAE